MKKKEKIETFPYELDWNLNTFIHSDVNVEISEFLAKLNDFMEMEATHVNLSCSVYDSEVSEYTLSPLVITVETDAQFRERVIEFAKEKNVKSNKEKLIQKLKKDVY